MYSVAPAFRAVMRPVSATVRLIRSLPTVTSVSVRLSTSSGA